MTSATISPSIDQAALQNFKDSYLELAQQKTTKLGASSAVTYLSSNGKTNNMARIGRIDLDEVATRNPDKQFGDYAVDNRQFSKRRFTKTIQIDKKHDVNELIKDPTSDIIKQLVNAKNRVLDRVIVAAAVGNVLTGAPDEAPTTTSAANDGVITVDATAGVTYEKIQELTENFINNDLQEEDYAGSIIGVTGAEHTDLMSEDKFINNDYINGSPVGEGMMNRTGLYNIVKFAGSVTGGIQVSAPIIPEGATTRDCPVLAPESVAIAMEIGNLSVEKSATKVNSNDITIDLWVNGMRTEGARVQILQTTI